MSRMIDLIAVDLQNEFSHPGGKYQVKGQSIGFIGSVLIPFLKEQGTKALEIISDYRQPRKGDRRDCCRPGEWGYRSILPRDAIRPPVWVKSMNSPVWVRENGGIADKLPGQPYQDPKAFDSWLVSTIGPAEERKEVFLFGLAADRCVLCTAMELSWRGYFPIVIIEATDVASGSEEEKARFLTTSPFTNWARAITFKEFKVRLERRGD